MTNPKPKPRLVGTRGKTKIVQHATQKTPRTERGTFVKGYKKPEGAGRAKGKRNRTTTLLKDAILKAAELVGQDGRGKEGLVGYLKLLAVRERAVFARLLEKVLPLQLHVEDKTRAKLTPDEAIARLQERGLPVPPSLLQLAQPGEQVAAVAHALNDQHEDGVTDDLDNRNGFFAPTAPDDYGDSGDE